MAYRDPTRPCVSVLTVEDRKQHARCMMNKLSPTKWSYEYSVACAFYRVVACAFQLHQTKARRYRLLSRPANSTSQLLTIMAKEEVATADLLAANKEERKREKKALKKALKKQQKEVAAAATTTAIVRGDGDGAATSAAMEVEDVEVQIEVNGSSAKKSKKDKKRKSEAKEEDEVEAVQEEGVSNGTFAVKVLSWCGLFMAYTDRYLEAINRL